MEFGRFGVLFERAVDRAMQYHEGQMYGKDPYMYHLWDVHDTVVERYGKEAYLERIVAILHDTLEDTEYTFGALWADFGDEVAEAVVKMTKLKGTDYFDYIDIVKLNPISRRVKACDSFCNLKQSFKERNHKRIIKYTTVLQLLEVD